MHERFVPDSRVTTPSQYHIFQHHPQNFSTPQIVPSSSLPPLAAGLASSALSERPQSGRHMSGSVDAGRTREDMRVINLLNARSSLS